MKMYSICLRGWGGGDYDANGDNNDGGKDDADDDDDDDGDCDAVENGNEDHDIKTF